MWNHPHRKRKIRKTRKPKPLGHHNKKNKVTNLKKMPATEKTNRLTTTTLTTTQRPWFFLKALEVQLLLLLHKVP